MKRKRYTEPQIVFALQQAEGVGIEPTSDGRPVRQPDVAPV